MEPLVAGLSGVKLLPRGRGPWVAPVAGAAAGGGPGGGGGGAGGGAERGEAVAAGAGHLGVPVAGVDVLLHDVLSERSPGRHRRCREAGPAGRAAGAAG